jgi:putative ABC transport system substrate-binding protein
MREGAAMTMTVGRKEFLVGLGALCLTGLPSALAQVSPKRLPLIGWLSGGAPKAVVAALPSFLEGFRDLGYVEGRDFDLVARFAVGVQDRLPALAEEIVGLKPHVIVAAAASSAVPLRQATATIPIVCPALADAVHLGLVASEARPGGNVTGIEPYVAGLPAKQMEFAREIVPGATRVGLLTNLKDPKAPPQREELEAAARTLEITIVTADVSGPNEIEGAMQALANQHVEVVVVLQTTLLLFLGQQIADLALRLKLPSVYGYREHVVAGGLISYGVDLRWCFRRGAYFVDKILRGTPPGELPVEFPTSMVLTINLRTAKALGVSIPATLLGLADEVIE